MWRGLMLTKAVEQFLRDVDWGELDDLLIDMPPGTGDVQMGLARLLPAGRHGRSSRRRRWPPRRSPSGPPTWPGAASCGSSA